jgi:uncharacterized membrane protein
MKKGSIEICFLIILGCILIISGPVYIILTISDMNQKYNEWEAGIPIGSNPGDPPSYTLNSIPSILSGIFILIIGIILLILGCIKIINSPS